VKLRIIQVIPTLSAGGAETLTASLAIELAKLGNDVKLFLTAGVRGERGQYLQHLAEAENIEVIGVAAHSPSSYRNVFALTSIINDWKPHIVHCHIWAEIICVAARMLACSTQTRYIRTLHNTGLGRDEYKIFWPVREHGFHRSVACSIAAMESYKKFLTPSTTERAVCVPNGCVVAKKNVTNSERKDAREILGVSESDYVLLHIGSFHGSSLETSPKAHDILIRAFARVYHHQSRAVLICAGEGELMDSAKALAENLGVSKDVRFLGAIPNPGIAVAACDVFVMPSRWEGLPMALIEVASSGIPVVASNIPAIYSICPSEGWVLVPPDDPAALALAIKEVQTRQQDFHDMAVNSAEKIRDSYNMRRCAEDYLAVYEDALRTSKSRFSSVLTISKKTLLPVIKLVGRLSPLPDSSK
jgi:glycosyltransferase involved in cell wall biosynthesis